MEGRKGSEVSSKRPRRVGAVALLVLGAALALALVSASSGSTRSTQATAAKPSAIVSTGKGFGEVYAAKTSTLAHTLFKATLLPKETMSRVKPGYLTFLSSSRTCCAVTMLALFCASEASWKARTKRGPHLRAAEHPLTR